MTAASRKSPSPTPPHGGVIGSIGYLALALALIVLIGIVAASIWLSAANRHALEVAAGKRAIVAALVDLASGVDRAETGQRGYLLTGKESYLEPYLAAKRGAEPALAAVARLTATDPEASGVAQTLRMAVDDKLAELEETIVLARGGEIERALVLVQTDRGQRDADLVRDITGRMRRAEQEAVGVQLEAINTRGRVVVLLDAAGLAGLVLLAAFLAYGVRRHIADLGSAQAAIVIANQRLEESNETLEETVRIRTADLVEANEEIQRFAYIVSHDLRAPLVNIMGFTGELETATASLISFVGQAHMAGGAPLPTDVAEAANDDIPEAIRFIKTSTAKMDRLIGAILRLSREGRRVLVPESLDMREVLESIAETLQHQADIKNAEIIVDALPTLTIDRVAAEQIFGNLLDNALKYLKAGRPGIVRISGRTDGSQALFEVRDNGRGIAPKDHERVFELFRRAGEQSVPGEGIGLAHVRTLVRRLGGAIDCDSALDEGTVFRVRLPLTAPPERSLAA